MGQPAARIGDLTVHGGTILMGCPNVLIGGMPAARVGDMHVCPMVTPAPAPVPHVGGPVTLGSAGVLIGGMPAARMGDMCVCVGPPDVIALGCFTVLIGDMGAGGGGGGGGGGGAAAASASAATAQIDNAESTTKIEHWVEYQFVDKAGLPVSGVPYEFAGPDGKKSEGVLQQNGRITRDALPSGQCAVQLFMVSNPKWSKDAAEVGEKVKLTADVEGYPNGTPAKIQIYRRDIRGPEIIVETIETKVQNNGLEHQWQYVIPEVTEEDLRRDPKPQAYSAPQYYFEAIVGKCTARSGLLGLKDWLEVKLKDDKGKPIGGKKYRVIFPNGEVREGTLDGSGSARIENTSPGEARVFIDPRP